MMHNTETAQDASTRRRFYRTEVTYVVLSERPVHDEDLATLLIGCDTGDDVGHEVRRVSEELSPPAMAKALEAAGSDGSFFSLWDSNRTAFLHALAVGDEVTWNDPDDGKASGLGAVVEICSDSGRIDDCHTIVRIRTAAGSEIEALPDEIE